jgi:hypothetical protein
VNKRRRFEISATSKHAHSINNSKYSHLASVKKKLKNKHLSFIFNEQAFELYFQRFYLPHSQKRIICTLNNTNTAQRHYGYQVSSACMSCVTAKSIHKKCPEKIQHHATDEQNY